MTAPGEAQGAHVTISPALASLLDVIREASLPALLVGSHGIGKSEFLQSYARSRGLRPCVLDLSLLEATDLTGMPYIEHGVTRFAPPATLPAAASDEPFLLVLEELNRCDRSVRQPCLQLLTTRHLNGYSLPRRCFLAACINPADAGGYEVDELDPALASRFVTLRVSPDIAAWLAWARGSGVFEPVVRLIEKFPQAFEKVPPRTWAYAARLLRAAVEQGRSVDDLEPVAQAVLPGIAARALMIELRASMPSVDAEALLRDPGAHLPVIERWAEDRRVDLLSGLAAALDQHLARQTSLDAAARKALTRFLAIAPADLTPPIAARLEALRHARRRPRAAA